MRRVAEIPSGPAGSILRFTLNIDAAQGAGGGMLRSGGFRVFPCTT